MINRNGFIEESLATGKVETTCREMLRARNVKLKSSDYDRLMYPVGINYLLNKEDRMMNTVLHKAETRGHANHGWLDTNHTFSFGNYHDPERMNFGALRVLNDDQVAKGQGFGTHPHDNMEIISIPLEGDLEHKDSMGNVAIIKEGDVQVLSAGTGIVHSEYNKSTGKDVKFLQIWVFPNKKMVKPRYDQISIRDMVKDNQFSQILSPNQDDQGVWIHQNAWFHLGKFSKETKVDYKLHAKDNGVYVFILEGEASIHGQKLNRRDGLGLWNADNISVRAGKDSKILLMEVPMSF